MTAGVCQAFLAIITPTTARARTIKIHLPAPPHAHALFSLIVFLLL
jgi:hypothetical protein